jgi:hypothetical protein
MDIHVLIVLLLREGSEPTGSKILLSEGLQWKARIRQLAERT